ncbi:hypothetical protein COW99_01705 [Candidatus Roizmanbacteria bacterium CG22_combo_CG10-13_8_21_14_all_38_20]|uniref:Sulfatase N-terminal domain-containing protein n=1 Tax=Candidatus Roizmanbacteria bacterium CG22_combo_CG10-13_8_21_14_all_38_20 TaxID=1974862 RepID=A0A2H0BY15_9BACT|nr:MAG: hypothetical protein COW99_01705 [Candidatus Roizmanbacteria bacterium CG22_combo_CG10-13_8_21_14_all_38_20]PJC32105.1 MAG: hypothetical protein CO050_01250 [Candidatus Roizmanbacteria bacterium CG_4_9_14_0_2_um_filter_38_17]
MISMSKKLVLLNPVIFAIYSVLFLYAHNIAETPINMVYKPLAYSVLATVSTTLILIMVIRNKAKTAFIASIFILIFFTHGHLVQLFPPEFNIDLGILKVGPDKLLFVSELFLISLGIQNARLGRSFHKVKGGTFVEKFNQLFFIMSIVLLLSSAFTIISHKPSSNANQASNPKASFGILRSAVKPDIYYLIFDRYAANSTLLSELDYDNAEFTNYLNNAGFYVTDKSVANYPKTFQSLASSLNMTYLNHLTDQYGKESEDQTLINSMLNKHQVGLALKELGYTYYHLGSWWFPTADNTLADEVYSWSFLGLDQFSREFLQTTLALPVLAKMQAVEFGEENYLRVEQKLRIPAKVKRLEQITKTKSGPKFVFVHMLLPHGPYIYDREGNHITESDVNSQSDSDSYLDQLIYTNKVIQDIVDNILLNSESEPIIIVQSDEGPCGIIPELAEDDGWGHCGEDMDWRTLSDNALRVKMRILNAYYLPNMNMQEILYPSISPVNSFRVIFNQYFNTNLELLPDNNYITSDLEHPYDFIDVTDKVKY